MFLYFLFKYSLMWIMEAGFLVPNERLYHVYRYIVICIGLPSSCSHEYLINLCKVNWFQYEELRKSCPKIFCSLVVGAVREVERQVQIPWSRRGNWTWIFQSLVGILNIMLPVRKKSNICASFSCLCYWDTLPKCLSYWKIVTECDWYNLY